MFTCQILKLTYDIILNTLFSTKDMKRKFHAHIESLEIRGLPQIDYIIGTDHITNDFIHDNVKNYQRKLIWKAYQKQPDVMSQKMEQLEATIDEKIAKLNDPEKIEQIVFEMTIEGKLREKVQSLIR